MSLAYDSARLKLPNITCGVNGIDPAQASVPNMNLSGNSSCVLSRTFGKMTESMYQCTAMPDTYLVAFGEKAKTFFLLKILD